MDPELQAHLDREAVKALTIAYTWALDRKEFERLRDVFLPDATARLGGVDCAGIDAIIARISSALSPLDDSQHLIGNHEVVLDGDHGTSRCYLQAQHVRREAGGSPNYIVAGRYEDQVVLTPAGWRIRHRDLTVMWTEGNYEVVRRDR